MLENPDEFVVDPPFNEKNEVILKSHLRALFFDFLNTLPSIEKIYGIKELKEFLSGGDSKEMSKEFKQEFNKQIKECFGNSVEDALIEFVLNDGKEGLNKLIFSDTDIKNVEELFNKLDEEFQIGQLRNADKTVEVTFQI